MRKTKSDWIEKNARRGIGISAGLLTALGIAMMAPVDLGGGCKRYWRTRCN